MTNANKMAALLQTDAATTNAKPDSIGVPRINQRERRALDALWRGPVMREALDKQVGCSNGPELVRRLIAKGIGISCTLVDSIDRDGRPCKPGQYELTDVAAGANV